MAASRSSVQLNEKGSYVCVPCSCSDVSGRSPAALPSSSESGTTSLQYTSLTILCSDINGGGKSPSFHQSAVSISNVSKSGRPATRKPFEKPTPRSGQLPQRTAAAATRSVKERASKTSSSMPRAATSSAKQATTATGMPIEKPGPSRSLPPQRTAEGTSSVKERALKTLSYMPRTATSSAKQATSTTIFNPTEKPSPSRPQPPQRTAAAATSSVKERALKTSSSMPPQRTAAAATSSVKERALKTSSSMPPQRTAAAATSSVKDRALKTSSSMSRAATSAAKQVSATSTLKAGRMTTTQPAHVRTRKSPGSVVSKRKETAVMAAPSTAQKQPVVAGEKDEKEASLWVDKQELVSASYTEVLVHDLSEVNNDLVPEILEPTSPPRQASQLTSNVDGNDNDRDDTNVPRDGLELDSTPSMEDVEQGEPEVKNDPVHEQHEPSSPPEQASQLTSNVEEDDHDIDVPKYEEELVSASSMEGRALDEPEGFFFRVNDEPEVNSDPVDEQHEPSSPPKQASQLTSNVDESDHDLDDVDVPEDEMLQASKEESVAGSINKEQRKAEKEEADAEENQKSPEMRGFPTGDFFRSESGEMVRARKETQIGNEVIEETTSKLLLKKKSKVKALVGAFETVISMQEPDGQTDQS